MKRQVFYEWIKSHYTNDDEKFNEVIEELKSWNNWKITELIKAHQEKNNDYFNRLIEKIIIDLNALNEFKLAANIKKLKEQNNFITFA